MMGMGADPGQVREAAKQTAGLAHIRPTRLFSLKIRVCNVH